MAGTAASTSTSSVSRITPDASRDRALHSAVRVVPAGAGLANSQTSSRSASSHLDSCSTRVSAVRPLTVAAGHAAAGSKPAIGRSIGGSGLTLGLC